MITDIQAEKLVVFSDLHLGNPFSQAKYQTCEFLRWASLNGYDIVINGDGFEIAQVSFKKIARDVPEVFHALKQVTERGRNVYYVVGNHDIVFENFLNDWGGFKVAPFLNVVSGKQRIRIEHGHLYDAFFVKNPELYEWATSFGGLLLALNPNIYKLWIAFEKLQSKLFWKEVKGQIPGEHGNFVLAARELAARGFDTIVFGHTHHVGTVDLGEGAKYFNPGGWIMGSHYVEINNGKTSLLKYQKSA